LKYTASDKKYTEEYALAVIDSFSRKEEKKVSNAIGLTCEFEKEYYYSNETVTISCLVKNLAPSSKKVEVCYRLECVDVELDTGESRTLEFVNDAIGGRLIVSAETLDGIKYDYVNLNVIQLPEISIVDFKPERISYFDTASVSFVLKTTDPIKNIVVDTGYGKFEIAGFDRERDVKYSVPARVLVEGAKLTVSYEDSKGGKYIENLAFNVEVFDKPWYIRFKLWLIGIF